MLGVAEADESFFGPRGVKGRRGHGAYGKTAVSGIIGRDDQFHTEIIPYCSIPTLQPIIRGRVDTNIVINSDSWCGYTGLVDSHASFAGGHFLNDAMQGRVIRIAKARCSSG